MSNIWNQVNVERIIISIVNVKTKLLHAHFKLNIFYDLNTYKIWQKVITKIEFLTLTVKLPNDALNERRVWSDVAFTNRHFYSSGELFSELLAH